MTAVANFNRNANGKLRGVVVYFLIRKTATEWVGETGNTLPNEHE
jgi:hypothetical protein